jgi:hypothetical protein
MRRELATAPDISRAASGAGEDLGAAWERHMRCGDFDAAWRVSDRVLAERGGAPCWHLPRHEQWVWNGTPLAGRRVLVRCYHGLGDTIQFIRYAPLLASVASEVIVWAQPALIPLLEAVPGIGRLEPLHDGTPGVEYDVDVEIMELPFVFRSTPDTLPREVPYLRVEPARLLRVGTLAVGVAWSTSGWDEHRSIPLDALAPLAEVPGVTLHLIQRGPVLSMRPAGFGIVSGSDDVLEAARVIRALDLVISIDSFPAHLAGALGRPTWTLLHERSNWRWMDGRDDTPWYPTMRLWRQGVGDGWRGVVRRVIGELERRASSGS